MNQLAKYIIGAVIAITVAFLAWFFSDLVIYILISAVLSLIGKPLMGYLTGVRIKGFHIPRNLASAITMAAILALFAGFFIFMTPFAGQLFSTIGTMQLENINEKIAVPLTDLNYFIQNTFPNLNPGFKIENIVVEEVQNLINAASISDFFTSITSFVFDFAIGIFVVSFITFFFLKEQDMFSNMILALFPDKFETNVKRALNSIYNLLSRYFIGISVEIILITILNGLGLHFIGGVDFSVAIMLGLVAGILNVIPYIGPWIGGIFGVTISLAQLGLQSPNLGMIIITLSLIFFITHMIDIFLFQPYIYSNSVQAHPLEIFIVILMAGSIGGVIGMLVAIPAYTVIRVFAREFFSHFKLVQKLTDKIN